MYYLNIAQLAIACIKISLTKLMGQSTSSYIRCWVYIYCDSSLWLAKPSFHTCVWIVWPASLRLYIDLAINLMFNF